MGGNVGSHTMRSLDRRPMPRRALLALASLALGAFLLFGVVSSARANGVPFNTGDVLVSVSDGLIKHFDANGNLLDTLDTTLGTGSFGGGMCFDSKGNLYATQFQAQTVSKFDTNGNLVASTFGSGYNADPESCSFNAADQMFVGQADGTTNVLQFDTSGNLLNTFAPAPEARGTDWVDLEKDQCTLQYTSEGNLLKQFNVCTNTQQPDFASNLPGPCYSHRILSDGSVLVACSTVIEHLDPTGNVIKTYAPGGSVLFALNLDPDGTSFWTADLVSNQIWRIDIATGAVITSFNDNSASGFTPGIAVVGEITAAQPSVDVTPPTQSQTTGSPASVTATLTQGGSALAGKAVLFSVTGANTASGSGTTNGSGQATFSYTGTNPGTDTVTACYDANTNGTCDPGETTGTATVDWTASSIQPLTTSKTADSSSVAVGAQDGYTITINNPNSSAVTLTDITDTLAAGFTYVPGSTTGTTTSDPAISGQNLTWSGSFSVPATGSVSLHFDVTAPATPGGPFFDNAGGDASGGYTVTPTGPTAPVTVTSGGSTTSAHCKAGQSCQTNITTAVSDFQVTALPGPEATLSESLDVGSRLECNDYRAKDPNWFGFFVTTSSRGKIIVYTVKNTVPDTTQFCFGAPYDFRTRAGTKARAHTLPDGTSGFVGLLGFCRAHKGRHGPCISSRKSVADSSSTTGFDTVMTVEIPSGLRGDPWGRI